MSDHPCHPHPYRHPFRRLHRIALVGALGCCLATGSTALGGPAAADDPDQDPPRATWDVRLPDSNGWFNHEVGVGLSSYDPSGLDVADSRIVVIDPFYQFTGLDEGRTSIQLTLTQDGVTSVAYDLYDRFGNRGSGQMLVFLDTVAPQLDASALPPEGSTLMRGSAVPATLACTDPGPVPDTSGVETSACGYDSGVVVSVSGSRLDTAVAGPLTVHADVSDRAGNQSTLTRHYTVVELGTGPRSVRAPSIAGKPGVSRRLHAGRGRWAPRPTALTFQWLRDEMPIPAATARGYRPTPADAGHTLAVQVTASDAAGSTTVVSAGVPV